MITKINQNKQDIFYALKVFVKNYSNTMEPR